MTTRLPVLAILATMALPAGALARDNQPSPTTAGEERSLDGSGNNRVHPSWGKVGTPYRRIAPANYGDRAGSTAGGPNSRRVSNRIFNDTGQNLFSERGVSQWAWTWGQFMDHTFGLAADGGENDPITFIQGDPLEDFQNDLGVIPFARDAGVPGTGTGASNPRQQLNTVSSYIDAFSVYGGSQARLEWLREGPVDGDMSNNGAHLLLANGRYLPRAGARGAAGQAPTMKVDGQLRAHPQDAAVAGDVRANENMALTAVHTLFAREHNRIVDSLPPSLTAEEKFQIARRVVGAEQQYVTYHEFLPSLGVGLAPYRGYRPGVDASLGNEFATVAYRAHSMIHGEFELEADATDYNAAERAALEAMGVEIAPGANPGEIELTVPLGVAFFNPDLVPAIGLDAIMGGLGDERQYKNDEQMDNALRSVLFQVPGPGAPDPAACFEDPRAQGCFKGVVDLGAIDIERGREHGMPTYNGMRQALGLPRRTSFTQITGEPTDRFRPDPQVDAADPIDDPDILDFVELRDANGNTVPLGSAAAENEPVVGRRRTTLAARLRGVYGSVDKIDAFTGMVSEQHVRGSELGPLQLAAWRKQFEALRDGDRFFYANDPELDRIARRYGVDYRRRLSDLIALNTGVAAADLPRDVFFAPTN